ncbi:MAG: FtsW/RodA/SpoVE family cell cycle protein [Tepidisphaeraceae bacterium]
MASPFHLRLFSPRLWQRLAIATNWPVLASMAVLVSLGLVTIWASDVKKFNGQLLYLGVAIACLIAFQVVNYQRIGRYAWAFYVLSFLPLLYTVLGSVLHGVPFVEERNGAYNWIQLPGGMSFQPSEVMKIAFIMALARYLRFRENYRTLLGLLPPFALCVGPVVLILKQPDLGTALIFGPTLLAMLFVAGAKLKHILAVLAIGMTMGPMLWLSGQDGVPVFQHGPKLIKDYQRDRVYAMFNDDQKTLLGVGMQQHRALIAMGSGGVAGKGFGQLPVGRRVPEGENDMIFALIGEQLGFVGCLIVIVAYVVLFAAGIEIAAATREPFGRLTAVGIVALLASQAFLNVAVSIKLFPVTGVTLPFISAGGSSLIASFMAASLLLNIGQHRPLVMAEDSFEFD